MISFLQTLKIKSDWRIIQKYDFVRRATRWRGVEARGGRGGASPVLFWKLRKVSWFWEEGPDFVDLSIDFSIQNRVLRVSTKKAPKFLRAGSFLCFWRSVYGSAVVPRNLPAMKILFARLLMRACLAFLVWTFYENIWGKSKDLTQFRVSNGRLS